MNNDNSFKKEQIRIRTQPHHHEQILPCFAGVQHKWNSQDKIKNNLAGIHQPQSQNPKQNTPINQDQHHPKQQPTKKPSFSVDINSFINLRNNEKKKFIDRRLKKNMILPSIGESLRIQSNLNYRLLPKPHKLDFMIDLVNEKQYKSSKGETSILKNRMSEDNLQFQKLSSLAFKRKHNPLSIQWKTEPSSLKSVKSQSQQKNKRQLSGPKVIYNQILKHSTNLSMIRNRLMSENRGRGKSKYQRSHMQTGGELYRSCNNMQREQKDVELLTFYPKSKNSQMSQQNQFLFSTKPQCQKHECLQREYGR